MTVRQLTENDPAPQAPAPSPDVFPLTDLQAGYLVGSSSLIELGGFRPTMYVEIDMVDFDADRARRAVDLLIARHEHLRTVVLAEGAQRVLDPSEVEPFALPVTDLTGLPPAERQAALLERRRALCERGVDPTGRPLFEVSAHRVRPHRFRIHLAMSLLLLDSGSTRQLQQEWWRLYTDPAAELPPTGLTFRDCVLARVAYEHTDDYAKHWSYWEDRLDTLPEAPVLPASGRVATLEPGRLVRRTHRLDRAQWQRLSTAFRAHKVLPAAAMMHVFAETLGAWAASPHFCLNVLHQNWATAHPETAGVVGQFSSTLPLEVDLRGEDGFFARAGLLQRRLWQDMAHSEVTAVQVTRELAARRGWTGRAALPYVFNSMLGPARRDAGEQGPACRVVHNNLRTPQVLIDNQLVDGAHGGVDCVWDVVDEAFPPGLADAMFRAYARLLDTLAGPDGASSAPDPVPSVHRAAVAADNAPAGEPPQGRLEDGFLRQAALRPAAPAVVTAERTLSYGDLEAVSRAVARWLHQQRIGAGDIVPVVMAKGWEQVAAALGVVRCGAAYCPVDAGLPQARIRELLDDCGARVVLGQSHRVPEAATARPVLFVDSLDPVSYPPAPVHGGKPGDLAYIIHTSGSTGRPKGVMIEHAAALNTVLDVNARIRLAPDDRVFGISSLSFDLSVWDVFGTLAAGAALVLPAASSRPDPVGWAGSAARHGVTVWNSVPALAEMLTEVAEQAPAAARPPLRSFLLSGDWVPTPLPDRMRALWPEAVVTALGGATEAAIWSNSYQVGRVDPQWRSIPYGRPLPGQTMRVLDHRLDVRPPGAVGRIHIGGAGLARGYWRDAERTAERFITHPATGERLYWTGDLGRYRPGGVIEFLGREDRQAKIQGFRVEPGEVEAAVRACDGVRDCAVAVEDGPAGQRRLVALVVAEPGRHPDAAALAALLRGRLPHYMVPGSIHVVDRPALSANGKVDVARTLAAARAAARDGGTAVAAEGLPGGRTAARLAELWRELLEADTVGPDSDFFALGGNSLLALRLVNRVDAEFGVALRFGEIFETPTLRALAERLGQGAEGRSEQDRQAGCSVALSAGPGQQVHLFHPVGGSVSCYTDFARLWAGPVRAFQHPVLARGGPADERADLAAMAAAYRAELQRLTPNGPYLLGGWSMGGVLAYEVAGRLAADGHQVRVFMIDSDLANLRQPGTDAAGHLEFLADLAGGELPAAVAAAVDGAPDGGLPAAARDAAVAHGLLPAEVDPAGYERLMRVHAANLGALARYRPAASAVPALLFVAGEVDRPDPVPAWRAVCTELETELWPADHYSIMAPPAQQAIAERVAGWCRTEG
ncbi:non-ribosomal peptide synthetase [Streptomyces sp. NBC_01198]|uniref:non-ribosomal peptide synthetase n=1 Tax=Streptomyces sp. NBC_01198 TaxID=2903769 RepID=UPI002E11E0F2|nr:amino acid adenylation domain-containing protein [Streptomyces sp. NBC_01198]